MAETNTISFSNLDEAAVQVEAKPDKTIPTDPADPEVPTPSTTPAASKPIDSSNLKDTTIHSNSSSTTTLLADPEPTSDASNLETKNPKKKKSQATPTTDIPSEPENEVVASSKAKALKSKRKPKKVASIDESPGNDTNEDEETAPKAKPIKSKKLKKAGKKADPVTPIHSEDEVTTTGLTTPGGKSKNPRLSPEDATKQMVHILHLMLMQKGGHKGVNWADIGRDLQVEGGMTADTARGRYLRHYEKNMKGKPGDTAPSGEGSGRRKAKAKGKESAAKESSEAGPSRKRKRVELSKERVDSNDDIVDDDVMEDVEMPDEVLEEENPKPVKRTRRKQTAEQKAASKEKAKAKKAEKAAKAAQMEESD